MSTRKYKGKIGKSINVTSNDPDEKRVTLRLEGFVESLVSVSPNYLKFKTDPGESQTMKAVAILSTGGSIKKISCDNNSFTFTTRPLTEADFKDPDLAANYLWKREKDAARAGRDVVIEVTLADETPESTVRGALTIDFTHPNPKVTSESVRLYARVGNPPKPARRSAREKAKKGGKPAALKPDVRKRKGGEEKKIEKSRRKAGKMGSEGVNLRQLSPEEKRELRAKMLSEKTKKSDE